MWKQSLTCKDRPDSASCLPSEALSFLILKEDRRILVVTNDPSNVSMVITCGIESFRYDMKFQHLPRTPRMLQLLTCGRTFDQEYTEMRLGVFQYTDLSGEIRLQ